VPQLVVCRLVLVIDCGIINNMSDTLFIGKTNFRNTERMFGIKPDDRRRHVYVIGKSGTGKSTLLENMIIADIVAGRGVCFVDPHGESAEKILRFIPESRINDVVYFNPADINFPIAFNPLERVNFEMRHLVASGLMSVFKKIWPDVWSARMEYILNNALLALLEYPNSTLLGIMKMLSDKEYRRNIVENLKDPVVKSFWVDEFAKYTQKLETEAVAAIQNKVGQFVSNPLIRNIVGQVHSSFDMRSMMDDGKILIANLSKGMVGEDNSNLLGAMLITKIQLAAMARSGIPNSQLRDFYLYVDEFQNFATESFATILSEARKYKLNLTLAHQYIEQILENVRSAIFGNVGTMIIFRIGAADAEVLEKEFFPEFLAQDFVNLPNANIYVKLMIDGISSKPFSATTLPPPTIPSETFFDAIIEASRHNYAMPREEVDKKIAAEYYAAGSSHVMAAALVDRKEERSLRETLTDAAHQSVEMARGSRGLEHKERKNVVAQKVPVDALKKIIRKALSDQESLSADNDHTGVAPKEKNQ
jgi:energy-coupling factor transporter ATP-binding protein EcfA2